MHEVTVEDAKRLLSAEEFRHAFMRHACSYNDLESVLKLLPQPPEAGIQSEDEYKRTMLDGLMEMCNGGMVSLGDIPGVGSLGMVKKKEGESEEDVYRRLEKLTGGRVVRYKDGKVVDG